MNQITKEIAEKMIHAIDDKLGKDTMMIDISQISSVADIFIITTADSERQTKAIADNIRKNLEEINMIPLHKEGYNDGKWILLDCGDLVVHILHQNERQFYNIEGIWKDGNIIDIDNTFNRNI
ncbi:ribosome silencing factor [Serpentinicella sp. ANB-PHB4]|uniref:ribosome silencing factor n=1 Tax=Serpentinicella sp. ANB-PHB4 TaxID=3074076 RepID=UPI0028676417|nr:ribosome silencing factor [Serpentinicella sp. ANB-PHB4]MDR5658045.1 ribosome silencing factor [Serpentinicella sp. ANB-PHB4]